MADVAVEYPLYWNSTPTYCFAINWLSLQKLATDDLIILYSICGLLSNLLFSLNS